MKICIEVKNRTVNKSTDDEHKEGEQFGEASNSDSTSSKLISMYNKGK